MSRLGRGRNHWRRIGVPAQLIILIASLLAAARLQAQTAWTVVGPAGGDARAFASFPGQPKHLLLGTTNSWLYESMDDGFVFDSVVIDSADPATIYAGAWNNSVDGGLWISHDGGRSWSEPGLFK